MPSITLEPWHSCYVEMAGNDFSWSEEMVTKQGLRTHRYKWGYGQTQFAIYGIRGWANGALRIYNGLDEGPHCSFSSLTFRPQVPQGAQVSEAQLTIQGGMAPGTEQIKIFGIASDDFQDHMVQRQGDQYPATYRQEYHPNTWGRYRRYRCDSYELTQEHTQACARVLFDTTPLAVNVKDIVNEIVSRQRDPTFPGSTGWQSGNRMCFAVYVDWATAVAPFGFVADGGIWPSHDGSFGTSWANPADPQTSRAKLSITY